MRICYERIALLLWRHKRNLRKTGRKGLDAGSQSIRHNEKVDTEDTTSRGMSSANGVSASKSRHIENVDTKVKSSREMINANGVSASKSRHIENVDTKVKSSRGIINANGVSASKSRHIENVDTKVKSSREMINANDVFGCRPRKRISERVTFMLSVLSFFFALNYLPYGVHQFAVMFGARSLLDTDRNLYMVTIRSYYVYSAVNAFVYISCSAKFRNECRRLFCKAMP
ncbi:hypothetical protein ACOMHN_013831 [Nucella lapillus]